jgi:hypothetical protein
MKPGEYQPLPPEAHDYVDGRLSSDDERAFERRVKADPKLAEQVATLRASIALLNATPQHEPPAGFDQRVLDRIRTEELAERARKRILPAPAPLWQSIVQVAAGAVAAAVVLALIGLPGVFNRDDDSGVHDPSLTVSNASVEPTEADLLPVLAEQFTRFESLRRNVVHTDMRDPDLQRQLIRLELELSGLSHSNQWLESEVARLPAEQRIEYRNFLSGLDAAVEVMHREISDSRRDQRPVNLPQVRAALLGVETPSTLSRGYRVTVRSELAPGAQVSIQDALPAELRLYAEIRHADYRHDAEAMLAAADTYLGSFSSGYLADHATAAAVAALLRLGRERDAAVRFNSHFSQWDDDLTPAQQSMLRGIFTEAEKVRLQSARDALTR